MAKAECIICTVEFEVRPARLKAGKVKFCSFKCRSVWRAKYWSGENNPRFNHNEVRSKVCPQCGVLFEQKSNESITYFRERKFCSRNCSRRGQTYRSGEDHHLFNPDSRRNNRRGKHGAWARAVISRDKATCQKCGATGVELHAHHIKPFAEFPELRWELSNGETLCYVCHWNEHTASNANGVNSGNILPGNAGDNPEPSFGRKPVEGVTTRGRPYRRWEGQCDWCGSFISKRWSDTVGKANLYCNRSCAGKGRRRVGSLKCHGSNSSTSAPHESDDIV